MKSVMINKSFSFFNIFEATFWFDLSVLKVGLNRYRTVCRLRAMLKKALRKKRRGAKCPRRDTQFCGELFSSPVSVNKGCCDRSAVDRVVNKRHLFA